MTMPAATRQGYRGYITPRLVCGSRTPQHVQNLVVRDYAARNTLAFKLSATEYVMSGCFIIFTSVLDELPGLEGIIAFSLFMLPQRRERRLEMYRRVLDAGASLHFAVENTSLASPADVARVETILAVSDAIVTAPDCRGLLHGED